MTPFYQWRNCFRPVISTISVCARKVFDGNLLCVVGKYAVSFVQFILLTLVWRSLAAGGVNLNGLTLRQLLTYTLLSSILHQQLNIVTPATSALWEGSIIGRFTRPVSLFSSLFSETVGQRWIPSFLFYSLPVFLIAPFLGIDPFPMNAAAGAAALLSLLFSVSLGFALDLLFASFAIRLKNGCWAATQVREALFSLLSGAFIPFALMPWGIGRVFSLLPFGSVANVPLSLYIGAADPLPLLALQLFWNLVLWPAAAWIFHRSREKMISYGG